MSNARHTIDYYMDGYCVIPFCKVCSAEGDKLLNPCAGEVPTPKQNNNKQKILDDERDFVESLLTK